MKGIYIILIISILFSNSLEFDNEISTSSGYSSLVDKVRKDVIDEVLLNLPKREKTDLLKINTEMSKTKEKYSLNDPESAYLVYKWIAENIEFNFTNPKLNQSPSSAFKAGKSGSIGITALFKNMCTFMKIESGIISGHSKIVYPLDQEEIVKKLEHNWNYILIDENYYLIDAAMGSGDSHYIEFEKDYSDFYFGTKPEIFIHWHFPEDNKWQLLSKTITAQEFTSMPFYFKDFFTVGFKDIEPKTYNITIKEDSKITLTYNESITDLVAETSIYTFKFINGRLDVFKEYKYEDFTISKGKIELNLTSLDESTLYLGVYKKILIGTQDNYSICLVLFKINFPKNMNLFSNKVFLSKKKDDLKNKNNKGYSFIRNTQNNKREDASLRKIFK